MKANSKIYKGIEYVEISDLPREQQEKIRKSIDRQLIIKILVDNTIVSNCLQYKDYELWFENVYKDIPATTQGEGRQVPLTKPGIDIAFNKAS